MTLPAKPLISLAIETSGHDSSVALGINDQIAAIGRIAQKRHAVDLVPTIDSLFKDNDLAPRDLSEIYISIGPGSFTGLRIGIAVAKLLARTTGAKLVAVPTLDSLAFGLTHADPSSFPDHVAILLNIKNDTGWGSLYAWTRRGFEPCIDKVGLITLAELLHIHTTGSGLNYNAMPIGDNIYPNGLGLICEILPESIESTPDPAAELTRLGITRLSNDLTISHASSVWHVGRAMSAQNLFTDPLHIAPLYAREPEAVTLWNKRHPHP